MIEFSQSFAALSKIWKSAEKKDKKAEYQLALLYLSTGKADLISKAVALLKRSARQRYVYAMLELGKCCENGRGVRKSYFSAIRWYKSVDDTVTYDLMNTPDTVADAERAWIRFLSLDEDYFGFGKDTETEEEKLEKDISGAEEGDADAQYRLGRRYNDGRGVKRDPQKALELFKLSAKQGNEDAIRYLADHFEREKNYKEAAFYYREYAIKQINFRKARLEW